MVYDQIEGIVVFGVDRIKILPGRIFDLITEVAVSRGGKTLLRFGFLWDNMRSKVMNSLTEVQTRDLQAEWTIII